MEIIKRYNNRKLYSTTLSKYVTINYVLDLVRTKQKFKVIDNSTGKDITTKAVKTSLMELPMSLDTMQKLIRGVK